MEIIESRASVIQEALEFHARTAQSAILLGRPGIGKSELVLEAAKKTGRKVVYHDTSSSDVTDIPGLPFLEEDRLTRVPYKKFLQTGAPLAIFFDEVFQSNTSVLNTVAPVFLEKRVGDVMLPPDTWVVGATNYFEDRAGVAKPPSHLPNRVTVMGLAFNADDWRTWAIKNNLPAIIAAFAAFRPGAIMDFDPARLLNATPRQWGWVGAHWKKLQSMSAEVRMQIVSGRVTSGIAAEFEAFVRLASTLPSVDDILVNPENTVVPEAVDARYAISGMLAEHTTERTLSYIGKYMNRMPPEYRIMWLHDSMKWTKSLQASKEFIALASTPQNRELLSGVCWDV